MSAIEVEGGMENDLAFDYSAESLEQTQYLVTGTNIFALSLAIELRYRHQIRQADSAVLGVEGCLQDVSLSVIRSRAGVIGAHWSNSTKAAAVCVKQPAEYGRTIKMGPAAPVNRAVARDQGRRVSVADNRVVTKWKIFRVVHNPVYTFFSGKAS